MLQPKIHDIFGSFPAVESFQGQFTFSLQLNRTRVNLKVDRDHFAQMVPEHPPHTHTWRWLLHKGTTQGQNTPGFHLNGTNTAYVKAPL